MKRKSTGDKRLISLTLREMSVTSEQDAQLGRSILLHRHDLPDQRGRSTCRVSGYALGVLGHYVPRGRRRRNGFGSGLNLTLKFRNKVNPRVDGASQA